MLSQADIKSAWSRARRRRLTLGMPTHMFRTSRSSGSWAGDGGAGIVVESLGSSPWRTSVGGTQEPMSQYLSAAPLNHTCPVPALCGRGFLFQRSDLWPPAGKKKQKNTAKHSRNSSWICICCLTCIRCLFVGFQHLAAVSRAAQCDDWLLPKTMAASLALRVTIPGTSMEFISGMRPCLDSRP